MAQKVRPINSYSRFYTKEAARDILGKLGC